MGLFFNINIVCKRPSYSAMPLDLTHWVKGYEQWKETPVKTTLEEMRFFSPCPFWWRTLSKHTCPPTGPPAPIGRFQLFIVTRQQQCTSVIIKQDRRRLRIVCLATTGRLTINRRTQANATVLPWSGPEKQPPCQEAAMWLSSNPPSSAGTASVACSNTLRHNNAVAKRHIEASRLMSNTR